MRTFLILFFSLTCLLPGQNAPAYLGDGSAVFPESSIRTDWNTVPPNLLWHRRIGAGATGFAIVADNVVVGGNDGTNDVWWCIDSDSGTPTWRFAYPEAPRPDWFCAGPVATALIDGDRVHVLAKSGLLHCLSLDKGELIWKVQLKDLLGGESPAGGFITSPVLHGDKVLIATATKESSLLALDRSSGELAFRAPSFGSSVGGTPRIISHQDSKVAVLMLVEKVVALRLEEPFGESALSQDWSAAADPHGNTPVWKDDLLFLPSGKESGFASFSVSAPSAKPLATSPEPAIRFRTAVPIGSDLVGVATGPDDISSLKRIDPRSGQIHWSTPLPGAPGHCVLAGSHLIVLCESGELLVGNPGDESFEELARITVAKPPCQAPLGFANNRVYVRNNAGVSMCMDVSPLKLREPVKEETATPDQAKEESP
jgi:outer membrane protein assembly factor BamB